MRRLPFLLACSLTARTVLGLGGADSPFVVYPDVRLWGADLTVGYHGWRLVRGVDTWLWAHVGGGWEAHALYRSLAEGDLVGQPVPADDADAKYNKITMDWQVGLGQGLLWSDTLERNLLELVVQSRWRVEAYRPGPEGGTTALLGSSLPDADGLFLSTVLLALHLDGIQTSAKRRTHDGLDAEASVEWAPTGLFGSPAGFVRVNSHAQGLATLAQARHVALVVGSRLEGDILLSTTGSLSSIPVWARTTLGGANPDKYGGESGLGGAVRGIHGERFDGTLKVVNNTELRLLFPEILPWAIFPGLIVFADTGFSDWRSLDRAPVLPRDLAVSAGVGLDLRALIADLVLYGSYCFAPDEARGFKVDFRFSTQF